MSTSIIYYKQNLLSLVIDNTSIGNQEFNQKYASNKTIGSVKFPNLTSVGFCGLIGCFRYCTSIKSIEFPSLATISESMAFYAAYDGCTSLTKISFPILASIAAQGLSNAFTNCTSLEEVTFPELKTVGNYGFEKCFNSCTSLKVVNFPKLASIGIKGLTGMFTGCSNLKEVHFPAALSGNAQCTTSNIGCSNAAIYFDL